MRARGSRIPGREPPEPEVADLPEPVRLLAVALSTATRVEPELLRAMRVEVRPTLDVGAESSLWFGPWSARNGADYMALRRPLLAPLRDLLRAELAGSRERDAVRRAGDVVFRAHHSFSPALALEERLTWTAVLADAGLRAVAAEEPDTTIDRLLESALRAAVERPERRDGLRRWLTGAWRRLPERVRRAPAARDLRAVLEDGTGSPASAPSDPGAGVADVVLHVRHDGAHVTVGDRAWPAEGILVPDTQPRILEVSPDPSAWQDAVRLRVPRGGRAVADVAHVPVFVRTARGVVYQLGAPASHETVGPPLPRTGRQHDRGLLGTRVADLTGADAPGFGVVLPPADADDGSPGGGPGAARLPRVLHAARARGGFVLVTGPPSSGRSRTAWEAMREVLDDWWVWCPPFIDRADALLDAVRHDRIGSHTVLWLDGLDDDLADPLSGEALAAALHDVLTDPGRTPLLLLGTAAPARAAGAPRPGPRAGALLRHATRLDVRSGRPPAATGADAPGTGGGHRFAPRGRLPARPRGFVGRTAELERLDDLCADLVRHSASTALGVVSGLPGAGKTAFLTEAAHRLRGRGWFPGGVLWVALDGEPLTSSRLLRALGVPAGGPDGEPARRELCERLLRRATGDGGRPVLLVLDDAAAVRERHLGVLPAVPGLCVLISTRGDGPVRDLSPITLGPLDPAAAVTLLAVDTALHGGDPGRVQADPEAAHRLAELCGRLPLALTIAARLLVHDPGRTVAELAESLARAPSPLDFLAHGGRSVRAALDESYDGLTPERARVFRLLALVPGPHFSTGVATTLLDRPAKWPLHRLAQFHLLTREPGTGRWRMHELVREYADGLGRQHAEEDGRAEAFGRLVRHYRSYAEHADVWLREDSGPQGSPFTSRREAVAWLERERESLVGAVDACLREGRAPDASGIALALAEFLTRGRHFEHLLQVMQAVLASPDADTDRYIRAAALNNFAVAMARTGDFDAAMTALHDAARLHTELGNRSAYALMLGNLGATLLVGNRPADAVRVLREAAAQYERTDGDPVAYAQVLGNLGGALRQSGQLVEAVDVLRRAVALPGRAQGPGREEAVLLASLGTALAQAGERGEALDVLEEAALRLDAGGDRRGGAEVLQTIGRTLMDDGRFDLAVEPLTRARAAYGALGDAQGEARTGNDLGLALLEAGHGGDALAALEQAYAQHVNSGNPLAAAQTRNNLGNALRQLGRYEEAALCLEEAVAELRAAGDEATWAQALLNLGLARLAHGEAKAAAEALLTSAEAHASLGDITGRALALHALGRAAHTLGDRRAVQHLRAANEAFRQGRHLSGLFNSLLLTSDLLTAAGRAREGSEALREALQLGEETGQDDRPGGDGQPGGDERRDGDAQPGGDERD
ncbi:tetratricopeptide repeat protein [Streptomyces sp. TRM 70351]|uniref:ATP-binding protein n=1 Tax=Streptomyces sp. TRM 70351 TaxID=3116552 RepID=UPI002E7AF915|nr:tetratricopeptide repeat protein [Streptomyces sp. TRM 70351]MEE1930067.1 tetratricopeptide repeat protein [Streptomyces sp. TRM 70351]